MHDSASSIKPTNIHILTSAKANFMPWKNVCCLLPTQSSSPISSSNLQTASCLSSSVSHVVVRGKFGSRKKAPKAITLKYYQRGLCLVYRMRFPYIVIAPSMINSHRLGVRQIRFLFKGFFIVVYQASSPRAPFRPLTMPAAINPENAPDRSDPEYNMAVLKPNSFLVYQAER